MLVSKPSELEAKKRQALARVYALLVSLAESKKPAQAIDIETKPQETTNEQSKGQS